MIWAKFLSIWLITAHYSGSRAAWMDDLKMCFLFILYQFKFDGRCSLLWRLQLDFKILKTCKIHINCQGWMLEKFDFEKWFFVSFSWTQFWWMLFCQSGNRSNKQTKKAPFTYYKQKILCRKIVWIFRKENNLIWALIWM